MSRRGVICLLSFLQRLLGNNNAKEIKKMRAIADHINEIEPNYIKLSDANLVAKTDEFKRRLQKGETLDDLLPEAFAVVREASKRVLGMRHFDVQLMGGICLHNGNIAEMRTGEGKTLVATLPVYLNALTGKGVHVVTVNDYLATRDSEQMGRLYNFLGLSTGLIVANLDFNQRKEAYACDITYGTNNEFGFDYLRDNMVTDVVQMVQRPLNYAIVDEVDSILIDEARTPLIISGAAEDKIKWYQISFQVVSMLNRSYETEKIKKLEEDPWATVANEFKVDDEVEGTVTKVLPYGAFVEIKPGVEGLVHISDFSWTKKKVNVAEYVKEGEKVKVRITDLHPEDRKLKLGIKQLVANPWETAEKDFAVGTVIKGKVVEVKPFGIFVEIADGIDAFVHSSDYNWIGEETPKFEIGNEVELKITELDLNDRKIKGSLKALRKSPWEHAMEEYKVGTTVEKKIKTVADFGLFVELTKGIDGFIPTQYASKEFIKNIRDKFNEGDVVNLFNGTVILENCSGKFNFDNNILKVYLKDKDKEYEEILYYEQK